MSRPFMLAALIGASIGTSIGTSIGIVGCDHAHDHTTHSHPGKGHRHTAPHGGTLVVLGEEFLHVELVLDPKTGLLTAYVLDGEAESPVRIAQPSIALEVDLDGSPSILTLGGVANKLTGETLGDTSEFRGGGETLRGRDRFEARIRELSAKGQTFRDVAFRFPEGNE